MGKTRNFEKDALLEAGQRILPLLNTVYSEMDSPLAMTEGKGIWFQPVKCIRDGSPKLSLVGGELVKVVATIGSDVGITTPLGVKTPAVCYASKSDDEFTDVALVGALNRQIPLNDASGLVVQRGLAQITTVSEHAAHVAGVSFEPVQVQPRFILSW